MADMTILASPKTEVASVPTSWFARLRSSAFVRNVGTLSAGTALGHAFTLAAAPVLTRIYGPGDFGGFGLFLSFMGVAGDAVTLRLEASIVSGRDESEAAYLTLASLLLTLPVSVLAGTALWGLIHFSVLGFGTLPWYSPLLAAVALCSFGVFSTLRFWCLREHRFKEVSRGVIVQSGARVLIQSAIGFGKFHSAGLLCGEAFGRCMGMSRMVRDAWPVLRHRWMGLHWEQFMQALWRNRKFPLYSLPSTFLEALCLGLTVPLLIRLYGVTVGGYYSLVWRAIAVPSVLVTVAVSDTFYSHLAACARETPDQIMRLFGRTSFGLALLGSIPAIILWFWGVPLFRSAFGAQWVVSGSIAAVIAPWYLLEFIVSPVSRVVLVLSGQETKLIWDVARLGALLAVFFLARSRSMTVIPAIKILTAVNVVLYVAYYLILVRTIVRFNRKRALQAEAQAS
jgi:O-antigen/teichoic acid export membrane protein